MVIARTPLSKCERSSDKPQGFLLRTVLLHIRTERDILCGCRCERTCNQRDSDISRLKHERMANTVEGTVIPALATGIVATGLDNST